MSRGPRPVRDLLAAVGLLTVVPVRHDWDPASPPRSTGWFPWVGWVFGGLGAALAVILAAAPVGVESARDLLDAALIVAAWALLSGMLHWDGLADTWDGLWGAREPGRRLEIMRDSRSGAFGLAAVVFVALIEVAAVSALVANGAIWAVAIAPVLGRAAAAGAAWTLPPARPDGLGAAVSGRPGAYEIALWLAALGACFAPVVLGVRLAPLAVACAAGVLAGLLVPRVLARKVGGMTGDLMGATVLLTEAAVLVAAAMVVWM